VSFLFIIITIVVSLNALWWIVSSRLSRHSRWRHLLTVFMVLQVGGFFWLLLGRLSRSGGDRLLPKFAVTALVLWHMLVLPILVILLGLALPLVLAIGLARFWARHRQQKSSAAVTEPRRTLSRREFLGFASAAVPPLVTLSLTGLAMRQLNNFRVRRFTLSIENLPADLDGMTIAQVSDMHAGRFTSGRVLSEVVRVTNELRSDLVLLTGDLINDDLAYLDHGIELVRAMQARFGIYLIEGNHDLIENGKEFERRVKASGIPFLLDESTIVSIRGTPVQLFGLSWTRTRQNRDLVIASSVRQLLTQRESSAFPILLAHHPHAFDAAAQASIPLTISGHTHGGQLMLNEQVGFGPAIFRYWSGLYTRAQSKLIVSNGVGNWFPLRINAPAEIIHLTLVRRAI
jgi:predicted MPP superfamily phosphohydrolase